MSPERGHSREEGGGRCNVRQGCSELGHLCQVRDSWRATRTLIRILDSLLEVEATTQGRLSGKGSH